MSIHIRQERHSEKPNSLYVVPVSEREAILTPESSKKKGFKKTPNLSEAEMTIEEIPGHFYIMNNIK